MNVIFWFTKEDDHLSFDKPFTFGHFLMHASFVIIIIIIISSSRTRLFGFVSLTAYTTLQIFNTNCTILDEQ